MPGSWLLQRAHLHLLESCPTCRAAWDGRPRFAPPVGSHPQATDASGRPPRNRPHHRDFSLDLYARETERLRRMRAIARSARRDLARLRRMPQARWADRVANARTCFRSRAFVLLLVEEARSLVRTNPERAAGFAALVPIALDGVEDRRDLPWVHTLKARAAAHHANALRVSGDLPAADRLFADLHRCLAAQPLENPAATAEIASLEASLRIGERRFSEAHDLLARAARAYRDVGDAVGLARTQIQRANLAWTEGEPLQTLHWMELATSCLRGVDPSDRDLLLSTVTGRVLALCELERFAAAAELLSRHRGDFEAASDHHSTAFALALEGRIALGTSDTNTALRCFSRSRDAFLDLGRWHDAAMACLDIAATLLAAGRMTELRRLAADLVPQFRSRGVEREMLASLRLLAEAARAETVTTALLAKLRRGLETGSSVTEAAFVER